jgi:two-component system, NarL family, capsular synthesis sensor histidine kinase RcsC
MPTRILIIEDHAATRAVVGAELAHLGYEVDMVESTEEACDSLDAREYDIVLSDLNLPGMSGIEFGRLLSEARTDVAMIAMSGMVDGAEQSRAAGFNAFLCKPFTTAELLQAITQVQETKVLH